MLRKIIGWLKELWRLLTRVSEYTPATPKTSPPIVHRTPTLPKTSFIPKEKTTEKLQERSRDFFGRNAIRNRFIEHDGYSEMLSVDSHNRYCIKELSAFLGNFVYMDGYMIDEFLEGVSSWDDFANGKRVIWVGKDDAVSFCYAHYAAVGDLL